MQKLIHDGSPEGAGGPLRPGGGAWLRLLATTSIAVAASGVFGGVALAHASTSAPLSCAKTGNMSMSCNSGDKMPKPKPQPSQCDDKNSGSQQGGAGGSYPGGNLGQNPGGNMGGGQNPGGNSGQNPGGNLGGGQGGGQNPGGNLGGGQAGGQNPGGNQGMQQGKCGEQKPEPCTCETKKPDVSPTKTETKQPQPSPSKSEAEESEKPSGAPETGGGGTAGPTAMFLVPLAAAGILAPVGIVLTRRRRLTDE